MPTQASLFPDPEPARLFLGIMLQPDARFRACEIERKARQDYGLGGDSIRPERLHVTLIHVGDYLGLPRGVIADVSRTASLLSWPAFDVVFGRAGSFSGKPGRNPYVLLGGEGLETLRAFRRTLWERLVLAGVKPLSRVDFNPHVTLLYGDRMAAEHPIEPIGWRASEFVLVHSELGRGRYNDLGRWALS